MSEEASPTRRRRATVQKTLATVFAGGLAVAALLVVSLALYTDTENVTNNTFSTGTIDLTATPATAVVTMPAMFPGDQITAPLTIGNAGSAQLRYAMTSTTTEDTLAGELVLTVKSSVTTCSDAGFGVDGTVLYTGPLGTVASTPVFGDPTPGTDGGDRVLAAGTNEILCVNVALPLAATSISEGLSTTATFTFDGEQTANNP